MKLLDFLVCVVTSLFSALTDHCGSVQVFHMYGMGEGCSPLSSLLKDMLFSLYSSKSTNI